MMDALNFASGLLAGFGVVMIVYVLVCRAELMAFWPRLGLAVMCAGIILNTPKQLIGWVDSPGGDWTYIVGRVGFAVFLWFVIWPHLKRTRLFSH